MFFRVTNERLIKAGFKLEKCEDGSFWVLEKEAGGEAERILRICDRAVIDLGVDAVEEVLLLQCDCDFSHPALCVDDFLWQLSKRDFRDIVLLLLKSGKTVKPIYRRSGT